ncbi:MAG: DUF262 domain-containing protein [Rikenellaceae bacterium]
MTGTDKPLLKLMDGSDNRFIIPVYQRNYDWKEANCKQLFQDLINLTSSKRKSHFFGSIVRSKLNGGGADDYLIIDGQQRLTTISLLLLAIHNNIKAGNVTPKNSSLSDKIWDTYIVDKYQKEQRKIRLKPIKGDCNAYDILVSKTEDEYIYNSNVTRNYNFFYNKIQTLPSSISVDELFEAVKSLIIIDIFLGNDDDPQLIFESLNSTGLDLTEADKIRNYILMGLDGDTQELYYEKYWNKIEQNTTYKVSEFMRDYLTVKTGVIPSLSKVHPLFKENISLDNIEESLKDILEYSIAYKQIVASDLKDTATNKILSRLNSLDMSVSYPFLMTFAIYARNNELPQSEILKIISTLEVYIFRRLICGVPTNALNKIFSTLHKEVVKRIEDSSTYSDALVFVLQSKSGSGRFPTDDEFKQSFITKNIYSMQSKNKSYLFERLENGDSKETTDFENLTIEHIMPQTLSDRWKSDLGSDYNRIHMEWLNTIANLTLTGYNSKYQNRPFKDKKEIEDGFNSSSLRLNQLLKSFDEWTEEQLKLRQADLVKLALDLWAYPTTKYIPKVVELDVVSLSDSFDFRGRGISSYSFMNTPYKVMDWTDTITGVLRLLCDLDSNIIYQEVNDTSNVWIFEEKTSSSHKEISDGAYIGTGNDTRTKINIIKKIFHKNGIDENELEFTLIPLKTNDK